MIREAYYEESASPVRGETEAKFYTTFKVAAIVTFIIAAFILSFSLSYVPYVIDLKNQGEMSGPTLAFALITYFGLILLIAGAGVVLWFMKNRFNVSYDYVFVEDELRVSKVFNGRRRKFLKTMKCDQMLKIGKCANDSFSRTTAGMGKKDVVFLTSNKDPAEGKEFYYILYSASLEKRVYIIEARQEILEYLVRAAGRNKWEAR